MEQDKPIKIRKPKAVPASAPAATHPEMPKKQVKAAVTDPVNGRIAIVLVRGFLHMTHDIRLTLYSLRLKQKNACTVVENAPRLRAAAVKCKDYIAYGEISEDTYNELVDKRGKKDVDGALKKYFLLHPPRGGFERKGIKVPFNSGGAIGYRGDKMNELIRKML
ncbi:MAG: uL30 family ribosomal protein [archaeon]